MIFEAVFIITHYADYSLSYYTLYKWTNSNELYKHKQLFYVELAYRGSSNAPDAKTRSRLATEVFASRESDHIARLTPTGFNKFWNVQHSMTRTDWTKIRPKTVGLSFKSDHIAWRDSTQQNSFVKLSRVGLCDHGFRGDWYKPNLLISETRISGLSNDTSIVSIVWTANSPPTWRTDRIGMA